MAKQTINIGSAPNDGTGTPLRTAFDYCNLNFTELYTATGPSGNNIVVPGSATITGDLTVDTNVLKVDTTNNRVGIRTASPAEPLTIDNTSGVTTGAIRVFATDQSQSRISIQNVNGQAYHLVAGNPGASNAGFALYDNTAAATRLYVDNTGVQTWQNVGGVAGTAMTLNANGLGVGATPSLWGNANKVVQVGQAGSVYGRANLGYYGTKFNLYNDNTNDIAITSNWVGEYRFELLNGSHVWLNKSTTGTLNVAQTLTQAMTLDASGNLLVGTTTNIGSARLLIAQTGTNNGIYLSGAFNTPLINFCNAGYFRSDGAYVSLSTNNTGGVIYITPNTGGVYISPGNTSWTANSDERLKDIIEPISNAISKVGSLRSVIGKWKTDPDGTRRSFLIAQDAQTVFPEVVDKNADGMLGVRYTEVIPLLVAAIKELTARVQTLEAK